MTTSTPTPGNISANGSSPHGAAPQTEAEPRPKRPGVLTLLKDGSYRNYWFGTFFYFLVFGAQRFAFVLMVLELTNRAGLAGVVGFALGIPAFFITVPAGVWADRFDRRNMVIIANLAGAVVMAVVAVLVLTDVMNAWFALATALAVGFSTAAVQPPLTAMVQMIVPPERLMNGIVLRTMGQNLAQFFGATVAGASITIVGFDGAFALLAVLYLVGIVCMLGVELERSVQPTNRPSMRAAATEGMRFVFDNPALKGLVIISIFSGLFMLGPTFTLMPEVARTKLAVGPTLNSLLLAFTSVGMLGMSMFLATRDQVTRKGNLFVTNMLIAGPAIFLMGFSPWYATTALVMVIWGMGGGIFVNMNQTLIQRNTPNHMMGRVMAIYALSIAGLIPLGALLGGIGAEFIGAANYMMVSGTILTGCAIWAFFTQHDLRNLD